MRAFILVRGDELADEKVNRFPQSQKVLQALVRFPDSVITLHNADY